MAQTVVYENDRDYYWTFITFSIDNHLFRVPKYRFIEDSEEFSLKYDIRGDPHGQEGDEFNDLLPHYIQLDAGVDDFRNFLKALYPKSAQGILRLEKDEWISVLRLSTKWCFNDFRRMAIHELTAAEMDPIERICLAKQYNISSWILLGCEALVERSEPITIQEAERLHLPTAISLCHIREQCRGEPSLPLKECIETKFATELQLIRLAEAGFLTKGEKELADREVKLQEEAAQAKLDEEYKRLKKMEEEQSKKVNKAALALDQERRKLEALKNGTNAGKEPLRAGLATNRLPAEKKAQSARNSNASKSPGPDPPNFVPLFDQGAPLDNIPNPIAQGLAGEIDPTGWTCLSSNASVGFAMPNEEDPTVSDPPVKKKKSRARKDDSASAKSLAECV